MKKKKFLLSPIIVLFLSLIALIVLTSLITPIFPNRKISPPLTPTSRPVSHFSPPLSPQTTLMAVGDIMLGRYVNVKMLQNKDWRYPFLKTADFTRSANITFGNLEAPFGENCPTTETGMVFCTRPEAIEGLRFAGFDVLSLANNHILNYGQKGLEQTKKLLQSSNILYSPLTSSSDPLSSSNATDNNLTIYRSNNISFGFLSFDLVTYPKISPISQIFLISPTVDVLIVSLHWGNEYEKEPRDWQKDLAHEFIDAGAKVIIGHHPHVTQPTEKYHDGLIFYSLGNFVFDQPWSEKTKKGEIAKIIFEEKNIKSYELVPIYIENSCQPQLIN